MPTLPNVQSLGARPQQQTGRAIQAPRTLTIGDAEQVAAPMQIAGQAMTDYATRALARRDVVAEAGFESQFSTWAEDVVRKAPTDMDLADEGALMQVGAELRTKMDEMLAQHQGSAESRARLQTRLEAYRARAAGQLGAISAQAEQDRVDSVINRELTPLSDMVYQDASGLNNAIGAFNQALRDRAAIYTPAELEARREFGIQNLARSAISGQMARARSLDDLDQIGDALTTMPGLAEALGPVELLRMREMVNNQRMGMLAEMNKPDPLVEIADPSSPSGVRYVPQSMAAGMPAPSKQALVNIDMGQSGPQFGTIPQGEMLVTKPDGSYEMRPVPGGPADRERQQAELTQDRGRELTGRRAATVVRDIDKSLALLSSGRIPAAGPLAGSMAIPGTPAFQLQIDIDSIKSNISIDELQRMREASPTGGALGQVPVQQQEFLMSVLGSLDIRQDPERLRENLSQIRELYLDSWFGTPEEHTRAVEAGRMTPDQAAEIDRQREVAGFDAIGRAMSPGQRGQPQAQPQQQAPGADEAQFEATRRAIQANPESLSAEEIAGMGFSPQQLQILADEYDQAMSGRPDG